MEATRLTNEIVIDKDKFCTLLMEKTKQYSDEFVEKCNLLRNETVKLFASKSAIRILDQNCYLDIGQKILVPDLKDYSFVEIEAGIDYDFDKFMEKYSFIKNYKAKVPCLTYLRKNKNLLSSFSKEAFYLCKCDDRRFGPSDTYIFYRSYIDSTIDLEAIKYKPAIKKYVFPIINLSYANAIDCLVNILLPSQLCPEGLSEKATDIFHDFALLKNMDSDSIVYNTSDITIKIMCKKIMKDMMDNPGREIYQQLQWNLVDVIKQYCDARRIGEVNMDIKEELLQCEKIRADIEEYEERILTDPNRGHWDLWRDQNEEAYTAIIDEKLVARNPICDINENGVIAIDFGTKSTIVVYQSDIEHSLPMRIGDGKLSKEVTSKRYENPTVMHFVNLEKFIADYRAAAGRPKTEWEDLTISHTAMEQFSASSSDEYYEYLHQIKQWAGQREKQFRIRPHTGESFVLPAFMDLKQGDFNPIEIYAYYIGLYINNMRKGHGIFLDYYLSFPVTYEVKIREKIVDSFERGLKKSLPETILNNQEIMDRFRVNGDVSEPAAYAVCALQEYGFEPEEDEEIFYGIFDFGGGTTDFDFGLWKQSSKRRYDYTIENFGAGGDEFLGGENLLEMLAFEIFKKNQDLMRKNGYTFTLAPKCKEFLGSDALLSDSQEAEKNMHNLMEVLRPFWEGKKKTTGVGTDVDVKLLLDYLDKILKTCVKGDYADIIEEEITRIRQKVVDKEYELEEAMDLLNGLNMVYPFGFENITIDVEEEETLVVTLFDKDGNDHVNEILKCSLKEINQFIEDKIREGVNNFFTALMLSYQNEKVKKPTTVNILLAGNSSKSPIVRKVFEEEIAKRQEAIKKKYEVEEEVENLFEIFPPLGTEEAYKKMEERGLTFERDNLEKPTGKTGVAFGLLQCRKGGNIERIFNSGTETEIPFQYFIGWRAKKKFVVFKDDSKITKYRGKPDYNIWYKFIEANEDVFDLYYTTLPECVTGDTLVDGNAAVRRQRCSIDVVDENAFVYIRAVGPHTLEYVVSMDDDVEKSKLGEIISKELG